MMRTWIAEDGTETNINLDYIRETLLPVIRSRPEKKVRMEWYLFQDDNREETLTRNTPVPSSVERCGTAGCIAGWVYLIEGIKDQAWSSVEASLLAREKLNLTGNQGAALFSGEWNTAIHLRDITKKEVVKELEKILRTGKILD